ncbi:MAG: NAD-dependent epimerase/dehydratase family protein [Rickettsiaceae bacterium]|nr:NAD-dependent epimerase/dehydratase family protein [Rickettsiaceae bacterium]
MSTYLVTGGAGFIGSHLTDRLINLGYKVIVLDDLSLGKEENINSKAEFIKGSISDTALLEQLFTKANFCYHLAATTSVQKSINDWVACHQNNLTATVNMFNIAAESKVPVVYASSAAVYGTIDKVPINEDINIIPLSPYGMDKYCCELQAKLFADIKGLDSIGLRFFNVYGLRQDASSPYSGVISLFTDKINNDVAINVYGDGNQERDFIHVNDVVQALIKAKDHASTKAEIYNVCTEIGVSINQLIKILFELSNKKVPINYSPAKAGDIYKSIGSASKIKQELNFSSNVTIKQGLTELLKTTNANDE